MNEDADTGEVAGLFDDDDAFRDWYDAALPRVYGYLYDRCGVATLAEELTQETFVHAVRNRATFAGRSDPMTWVIAIGRHKLADHLRRMAREERRNLRVAPRPDADPSADPERAIEEREDVLRCLRTLPPMQRAALVLHYLDRLPVAEVAIELERSEAAVESLLSRGRDGMRSALRPSRDEEAQDA